MRFLLLLFIFPLACGYIYTYDNEMLKLGHLEYRRVGLYTKADSPLASDRNSYIQANVSMSRLGSAKNSVGILQLILAHSSTFDHIGFVDEASNRHFCCTQDLLDKNVAGCSNLQLGKAAIAPNSIPHIQVLDVVWPENDAVAKVNHRFTIDHSGRYYLLFSSCLNSTGDVGMSGNIVWMNPYGYLPGELYHFIPLYRSLAIGYLVLGLVWAVLCFIYRADSLPVQNYIGAVIFLGFLETGVWYFDYQNFNDTGTRPIGPIVAGVILSSLKRTLSRLLVVVVCMGYGVMREALENDQRVKVIVLGVVYFVFSSIYDIMTSYAQMTHVMQHIHAFFLFPVAALDSLFFLWILQEISTSIQLLTEDRQDTKLLVYRRFWQILVTTAVFSILWGVYQVFVTVFTNEDSRWDTIWSFEGMWHVLYFVVLVAICVLWRPHANAKYLLQSREIGNQDDFEQDSDGEGIEMTSKVTPSYTLGGDDDY